MPSKKPQEKARVKKIVLDLGDGKTIELSVDAAKELHQILHELFGGKAVRYAYRPYWDYNYWDSPGYPRGTYTITGGTTCSASTGNITDTVYLAATNSEAQIA